MGAIVDVSASNDQPGRDRGPFRQTLAERNFRRKSEVLRLRRITRSPGPPAHGGFACDRVGAHAITATIAPVDTPCESHTVNPVGLKAGLWPLSAFVCGLCPLPMAWV